MNLCLFPLILSSQKASLCERLGAHLKSRFDAPTGHSDPSSTIMIMSRTKKAAQNIELAVDIGRFFGRFTAPLRGN